jgi:hypothetical protein
VTPELLAAAAEQVLGRPVSLAEDTLRAALDPWHAVQVRGLLGGPSPGAMRPLLDEGGQRLASNEADLAALDERVRHAATTLEEAVASLTGLG